MIKQLSTYDYLPEQRLEHKDFRLPYTKQILHYMHNLEGKNIDHMRHDTEWKTTSLSPYGINLESLKKIRDYANALNFAVYVFEPDVLGLYYWKNSYDILIIPYPHPGHNGIRFHINAILKDKKNYFAGGSHNRLEELVSYWHNDQFWFELQSKSLLHNEVKA